MTGPTVPALPDDDAGRAAYYGDAPHGVRTNMVMTADGAGAFRDRSRGISDDTDLGLLLFLRHYADVILVGAGTAHAENYGQPKLPEPVMAERAAAGLPELPRLAVVTASGHIDPSMRAFQGTERPLVVTGEAGARRLSTTPLEAEVVIAGGNTVDLPLAVASLQARGMPRVLCEGGPTLLAQLVEAGVVEDFCLSLSPLLAGHQPVGQAPKSMMSAPQRMELRHVLTHDGMLYLRWSRAKMEE